MDLCPLSGTTLGIDPVLSVLCLCSGDLVEVVLVVTAEFHNKRRGNSA